MFVILPSIIPVPKAHKPNIVNTWPKNKTHTHEFFFQLSNHFWNRMCRLPHWFFCKQFLKKIVELIANLTKLKWNISDAKNLTRKLFLRKFLKESQQHSHKKFRMCSVFCWNVCSIVNNVFLKKLECVQPFVRMWVCVRNPSVFLSS